LRKEEKSAEAVVVKRALERGKERRAEGVTAKLYRALCEEQTNPNVSSLALRPLREPAKPERWNRVKFCRERTATRTHELRTNSNAGGNLAK